MLWTKSGYSSSVIFSLLAKSSALSNGILCAPSQPDRVWRPQRGRRNSPDALEMHRANLYDVPDLLALENAVTAPASHASNIQQLGAIDHVIVCENTSVKQSRLEPGRAPRARARAPR